MKIKNFKSLANVVFTPSELSVLIGPNNSGKTNFVTAIRFLSEVYEYGLETAVRRGGGYENIALRKLRRSKSAIRFDVTMEVDLTKDGPMTTLLNTFMWIPKNSKARKGLKKLIIHHSFSFRATKQNIKAEFKVEEEEYSIKNAEDHSFILFNCVRHNDKILDYFFYSDDGTTSPISDLFAYPTLKKELIISSQELFIAGRPLRLISPFTSVVSNWIVYQFNPIDVRREGVPTPNPEMDLYGRNLPAVVDWLINKKPKLWESVIDAMTRIIPGLINITTGYLHNKTLGLFFHEDGFGRPWNSEEISDGTILTLSMLCAIIDPRKELIVLEEPENSVHPWIIREIMAFIKEVSFQKNIIVTTHSIIIIDLLHPDKIWTIYRNEGESFLQKLLDIDSELLEAWETGKYKVSQFIDSGLIPKLVP
ncbi:MAG: AAA family ATPase [Bacteroidetes bacterium]|nr:AAA family ATPase [Bacteroidota bacterium]